MMVNWEISVGNLIYLTVIGIGGIWALLKLQVKVDSTASGVRRLEHRAGTIETAIKELEQATVQLAVQGERMNQQDARMNRIAQEIRDIRHGRGFVLDLPGIRTPNEED